MLTRNDKIKFLMGLQSGKSVLENLKPKDLKIKVGYGKETQLLVNDKIVGEGEFLLELKKNEQLTGEKTNIQVTYGKEE